MPDYKRKKFKKFWEHKKLPQKPKEHNIKTKKSQEKSGVVPENDIKVVRGKKFKRARKIKIFVAAVVIVCITCIVLSITLPVSLSENISNLFARIGPGSYPISVSGAKVINTISNGSHYFVLTDTNISAYSNAGKIIFDELHGFSNPMISVSSTRIMIYDLGGKLAYIYNLNGKIHTIKSENEIITASISWDGDFAIATHSDRYTSVVTVYNKDAESLFTWNSAKDIIDHVLVDEKGEKLAVTTLNAKEGQLYSQLMIFDFNSADPIYTLNLDSSLPLALDNTGKGISIICKDKYKFLNWTDFTTNEIIASGEMNVYRKSKDGLLLVFNRANDRSDNIVVLVNEKGEEFSQFKINYVITDIQYTDDRVYSVSDMSTTIYDKKGKVLKTGECNYGVKYIAVIASNSVAAITDNEIVKTNIEK